MIQKTALWGIGAGFYRFPKYHIKVLLLHFNEKVGRENIFKPKSGMRVCIRIVMIMGLE